MIPSEMVALGAKFVGCLLDQIPTSKHKENRNATMASHKRDTISYFYAWNEGQS